MQYQEEGETYFNISHFLYRCVEILSKEKLEVCDNLEVWVIMKKKNYGTELTFSYSNNDKNTKDTKTFAFTGLMDRYSLTYVSIS